MLGKCLPYLNLLGSDLYVLRREQNVASSLIWFGGTWVK